MHSNLMPSKFPADIHQYFTAGIGDGEGKKTSGGLDGDNNESGRSRAHAETAACDIGTISSAISLRHRLTEERRAPRQFLKLWIGAGIRPPRVTNASQLVWFTGMIGA